MEFEIDDEVETKIASGEGGGPYSFYQMSLGAAYADIFRRDRQPSQIELLSHLVGTAYKCANANADLVASTKLRLYLRKKRGIRARFVEAAEMFGQQVTRSVPMSRIKDLRRTSSAGKSALLNAVDNGDDIVEVKNHPILDLLRTPEDVMTDGGLTSYDFRYATQLLLESVGRAYWYVKEWQRVPGGKIPNQLVLLRSQLVVERVDTTGAAYIQAYSYGSNTLSTEDVIRFAKPDPSNPHLGFLPPMRAAIEKVRLARGDDAFVSALLQNGGYPAGIISPKDETGSIGHTEAARITSAFRSAAGMSNAGKLVVVGSSAIELKTLAWKPTEIISLERNKELQGQICDCFDVPRTKIFRDTSNRASAESGDAAHAKDAGLPRCSRTEETLNGQLVPLFDDSGSLFLAFDNPVSSDKQADLEETKAAGQLGAITLNEQRVALGFDPIEDAIGDCRVFAKGSMLVTPDGRVIAGISGGPGDTTPAPMQRSKSFSSDAIRAGCMPKDIPTLKYHR